LAKISRVWTSTHACTHTYGQSANDDYYNEFDGRSTDRLFDYSTIRLIDRQSQSARARPARAILSIDTMVPRVGVL